MARKLMLMVLTGLLMLNLCGCFAIFLGVAGGAGTAVWLSGKLTQEFHTSYQAVIDATKSSLQTLDIQVLKETHEQNVTQFKGIYNDGKKLWIDITRVTDNSTRIEIRVGVIHSDKKAASLVLKKIQSFLSQGLL